ncbi:protein windbeutel [Sitodiplosis mosellana]|uniref:protein windbeutel n=1 Tax=Sitodiplosis mosellana TaxID=263140 RepID=UPI00244538A4|nr:protein windbeutel [Sitodiplosis mosellana]
MSPKKLFAVFLLILINCSLHLTYGLVCEGCLELDEITFDKILAKFSTVLVKFDIAFPYGKKHDEYAKFAKEINKMSYDDLIVSVVGIKNYGQTTNNKLAERFNVNDQLPEIKLFTNGNALKWIDFPKDANITTENLQQFLRRKSNVKIILPECLKQFDEYAAKFVKTVQLTSTTLSTSTPKGAEAIVNEASREATKLETKHQQQIAQIYLLIMRRILERNISFIGAERSRLQKVLDGKISDQKRKEINQKLNILSAFDVIERAEPHTEL